ncbi:MAG: hypothetical protein KFF50_02280 [Desulfatitalea sp.]|nr:hypothetical protein [Desulfatitalea sp.]
MKPFSLIIVLTTIILMTAHAGHAMEIAGVWTKTTHPDPNNIIVLYRESGTIKAIGYEQVGDMPANWHGDGKITNDVVELRYRYSADATPAGWEPRGRMVLTLSGDGQRLHGTATSRSGGWSDRIELMRVAVILQP